MKLSEGIPLIATIVGCWLGYSACSDFTSPNLPTDNSGRTSIVVHYDKIGWCELRGPARYAVLAEWEAYEEDYNPTISADYAASVRRIRNPGTSRNTRP